MGIIDMMLTPSTIWHSPSGKIDLSSDQIHLWRARLDMAGYDDELFWEYLSESERERANRIVFPHHRLRFIRSHGISRAILARYCKKSAGELKIANSIYGKPFLENCEKQEIKFNLSHSEDLMVIGIAPGREIGVDIEVHSSKVDWRQIAKGYFCAREIHIIESQESEVAQISAFYQLWTSKEAYMKACGQGMAVPLHRVEVEFQRGNPAFFIELPGGEAEIRQWQLFGFLPVPGGSGSIVIENRNFLTNIETFDFVVEL